jgi:N-acetyltransferase 10
LNQAQAATQCTRFLTGTSTSSGCRNILTVKTSHVATNFLHFIVSSSNKVSIALSSYVVNVKKPGDVTTYVLNFLDKMISVSPAPTHFVRGKIIDRDILGYGAFSMKSSNQNATFITINTKQEQAVYIVCKMVRKRLDDRVRALMELSMATQQRSMLVLVGDHGKDQIPNIYQILSKCSLQVTRTTDSNIVSSNPMHSNGRPKVLWCYKKELGFSTHRMKRMKKLKRDKARGLLGNGSSDANTTAENFELFISQTDINWCYYKDSHRVLGTTVGMLVLQDFEALTPNLLARTIETVCGGGLVIFLFRTVKSLRQLYAVTMDVHARYRTESANDVIPRFNERFILSLGKCPSCLVCDDELNVLPISRKSLSNLVPVDKSETGEIQVEEIPEYEQLRELQESLIDTPHIGVLTELTRTLDQAKAVLTFLEACSDKHSKGASTIAMTAPRGRGKSAAIGLCLAGALSLGFSTIYVTAPAPENLVSVFDFTLRGLKVLKYQEHMDFTVTYNSAMGREETKCVLSIAVYRNHRQIIQYVPPDQTDKFAAAEIVAIDEAAAIPLPVVRAIVRQSSNDQQRLTLLSSTVNGYEGTGRALSLKLLNELRERGNRRSIENSSSASHGTNGKSSEKVLHEQRYAADAAASVSGSNDKFFGPYRELELTTPIRYAQGDAIESWLNKLLCLDSGSSAAMKLTSGAPAPGDCELYSVDRDALFSYHKLSEAFLQKIMGLYTSAHYKNTPNDLQMLSDAPAHAIFVLLSPSAEQDVNSLPDVLAVIQVALEGKISRKAVEAQLARGHRSAGDLIPWTLAQQFGDSKFAQLSGARIVRVAVHPSVQGMGYGTRAMELLYRFYNGEMIPLHGNTTTDSDAEDNDIPADESDTGSDDRGESFSGDGIQGESLKPRKELPPLLLPLTEINAPRLDWIGTSFGLTLQLHRFWARCGMRLLYLRQTKNDLTGEHSAIMVRALPRRTGVDDTWLSAFVSDTRRRIVTLLGGPFRELEIRLALSALENLEIGGVGMISANEMEYFLSPHDRKRLELYGRNLCDHHLITDLLPIVARIYFLSRFGSGLSLSNVQSALLCGIGLQNKTVDELAKELSLPLNQVLAMFNKAVRKISIALSSIVEADEKQSMLNGFEESRKKSEVAMENMRDVVATTVADDANDISAEAWEILNANEVATLPPEIAGDQELMSYVVKGSKKQWESALETHGKSTCATFDSVQILGVREKRRALEVSDFDRPDKKGASSGKKKRSKSKRNSH